MDTGGTGAILCSDVRWRYIGTRAERQRGVHILCRRPWDWNQWNKHPRRERRGSNSDIPSAFWTVNSPADCATRVVL